MGEEDDDAWDEEDEGQNDGSDSESSDSDSDAEITDEIKGKDITPEKRAGESDQSIPVPSESSGSHPPGPAAHSSAAVVSKGLDSRVG